MNGNSVYIDAGTNSGLAEGTQLVLKQSTSLSDEDAAKTSLEPGVVARLKGGLGRNHIGRLRGRRDRRDLVENDVLSLPEEEVKKIVEKDALGNTRTTL